MLSGLRRNPVRNPSDSAYTSDAETALSWKHSILGQARTLVLEELEDEFLPRWRAKIINSSGGIVSQSESYETGAAVIIAVLDDLITNDGISWWIEVTD
jgi:hypothetical protein